MKGIWNKYKREFVVLIATLAMCVVFTVLNKNFLNYSNFLTVLQQMVLNGILAVGMMFTIITGGIDLSVGCTYAITGIVVASCTVNYGMNPFLAILVGILIGAVLGAFNGFLINQLTGGVPVTNVPTSYRDIFNGIVFGGVRSYIIVMVVVFVIAHILLSKMSSGDYLYAVGGNEEAAKLSGVNVIKTKYIAYIFCGICAAIAGMIMLASLGSAEATAGQAYETNAIAAAAIGGTRMAGGKGTALGTFIGALMLAVLKVGMVVINVDSFWQFVVTGIIIIVASYFEFIQQDIKGFVARHKKAAN